MYLIPSPSVLRFNLRAQESEHHARCARWASAFDYEGWVEMCGRWRSEGFNRHQVHLRPFRDLYRFVPIVRLYGLALTPALGQPRLLAELPPQDATACAFFLEWRTSVCRSLHPPRSQPNIIGSTRAQRLMALDSLELLGSSSYRQYQSGIVLTRANPTSPESLD